MMFLRALPLRSWLILGAAAGILALFAAFKYQQARADRAQANLAPAVATGKALDKVATETPVIRQDQKEKENEVSQIPGANDRLPDGFGARLECVRDGRSDCDS